MSEAAPYFTPGVKQFLHSQRPELYRQEERGCFVASAIGTYQSRPLLRDATSKIHFVLFQRPDIPLSEFLVMRNVPLGRWVSDSKNLLRNFLFFFKDRKA